MTPADFILAAFPYASFMLVAAITPGPNNFMVAASGMNYGYRRTLPHIAGIIVGFATLLYVCMLGIGAVFDAYPSLIIALKILGGAYLLYLAWRIAQAGLTKGGEDKKADIKKAAAKPFTFIEAALFQYINPKAWMMGVAATASFLPPDASLTERSLIILITIIVCCIPSVNIWALFGKIMARLFTKDKYRRAINIALALLLVATIPMMVMTKTEVKCSGEVSANCSEAQVDPLEAVKAP